MNAATQSLLLFQKRGGSTVDGQIVATIIGNNPHCGMSSVEIRNVSNVARRTVSHWPAKYDNEIRNKAGLEIRRPEKKKPVAKGSDNKKARHCRAFDECLFCSAHLLRLLAFATRPQLT
ncbi:hypothetical protein [Bradyrhizobium sp. dw_411]|uniref:hypothetical protein n=1 Tax=Bradyrhizobium sp. dw_411 TaxID=2720082 RepID=UPI001BCAE9A3|nr:hypothetical protein [Bradyrhizobium sp. dw_411]